MRTLLAGSARFVPLQGLQRTDGDKHPGGVVNKYLISFRLPLPLSPSSWEGITSAPVVVGFH